MLLNGILSEFYKQMGREEEGIPRVDEAERGLYITWVDNNPKALAKQPAIQKMDKAKKDDEERVSELLKEQIEKASKSAEEHGIVEQEAAKLKRDGEQPIKLSLNMKPVTVAAEEPKPTGSKMMMGGMKRTSLSALAKKSSSSTTAVSSSNYSSGGINMGSMMMKRKSNTDEDQDSNKKIKA